MANFGSINLGISFPKCAYIAESWFNQEQRDFKNAGLKALKKNKSIDFDLSFIPENHQYKGVPDNINQLANTEWQLATFRSDCQAIDAMDIVIALYDPTKDNLDDGQAWELGYAYALHKPNYVVLPDVWTDHLNLMPALGATQVLTLGELETFDFMNAPFKPFQGTVI